MKVLLITTLYPGYKGQSRIKSSYAVHGFAKEWAEGNEVDVIRLWPYYPKIFACYKKARRASKYSFKENFILDNVNVFRLPIRKMPKISYREKDIKLSSRAILETMEKRGKPDLIICDMLNPSIYIGEIVAQKYNSRLVASLHNSDINYLSNYNNYKRFIEIDNNINKIICRSEKIRSNFLELYDGHKVAEDIQVVLFGIDKGEIINGDKLGEKLLNPNRVISIAAGLKKLKNVDILIEAFAGIENKKGYVLKIIGDGPERTTLEKKVKDLDMENYIYFEGEKSRSQVLDIMEESDIFAMVSSPETFGLVYIEAMAKGCITIGSRGEGIDGVIINGSNGFLCKPGDAIKLRAVLEKAIALDYKERKRIIMDALKTAGDLNNQKLADDFLLATKDTTISHEYDCRRDDYN